jgi:hypothetical protein
MLDSESLPSSWLSVLNLIIEAKKAWHDGDGLDGLALFELRAAGFIVAWELNNRPTAYTLTPWGAQQLGVRLVEGRSERAQWRPAVLDKHGTWIEGGPLPIARRHERERPLLDWTDKLIDPKPHGIDLLIDEISGEPVTLFKDALRPNGIQVVREKPRTHRKAKKRRRPTAALGNGSANGNGHATYELLHLTNGKA